MKTRTLCTWIAALGVFSLPVWAQTAPGPVHVPSGYATNSTVIAPASSLTAPPPPTNAPSVMAPAIPAQSAAASADDDGDIRDIRGVVTPPNSLAWFYYAVGGVALAALLYFAWRWLRRTVIKPKLAHEIALERLEAARALMTETQVREYAFAVSEVIRTYIEKRFRGARGAAHDRGVSFRPGEADGHAAGGASRVAGGFPAPLRLAEICALAAFRARDGIDA